MLDAERARELAEKALGAMQTDEALTFVGGPPVAGSLSEAWDQMVEHIAEIFEPALSAARAEGAAEERERIKSQALGGFFTGLGVGAAIFAVGALFMWWRS